MIGRLYIGKQIGVGSLICWGKERRRKEGPKRERDGKEKEKRESTDVSNVYLFREKSAKKAM